MLQVRAIILLALLIGGRLMAEHSLPQIGELWNFKDPAASEIAFRNAVVQAHAARNVGFELELLTQVARTYSLRQMFSEGHATLDSIQTRLPAETTQAHVRYHLERGRCFNSDQQVEKATAEFLLAVETGRQVGNDRLTIDALHMLGISEKGQKSLDWNMEAIKAAEESSDDKAKGWLGPLYNNTGWTWHDMGAYDQAMTLFKRCLDWHKERQTGEGYFIARWTVARCHRSLNQVDQAFELQRSLAAEIAAGKSKEDGFVHEELGELLLLKDQADEARQEFALAYPLLAEMGWLVNSEPERLDRVAELAGLEPSHRKGAQND